MDMAKRVGFGVKEWVDYVEFRIQNSLKVEQAFTLAMLEMEVPYDRLGFENFQEFLKTHVTKAEEMVSEKILNTDRIFITKDCIGDLKVGSRVIWFGSDSTTFKGTVKWLGSIERILCAGVFADEKIGSPFPILWRTQRLYYTPPGHSLMLRVNELILKSDYAQRQTSLLSRALSKLMRKVSIRERPREPAQEETITVDSEKLLEFDVIYPFAVDTGPNELRILDTVVWANGEGSFAATVRWLGHLTCQSGLTVGIEFKSPVGNCSGTFEGHKLFECKENHGKFLCVKCVRKVDHSRGIKSPPRFMSTPTFEVINQDLSVYWHLHQQFPKNFQLGDLVLYQRDISSYYTGKVAWIGNDSKLLGIQFDTPIKGGPATTTPFPTDCPSEVNDIVPVENVVKYNPVAIPDRTDIDTVDGASLLALPQMSSLALACRRLSNRNRTHNPTGRASHEWFPQKGIISPCISPERLNRLIGYRHGIQGRPNSSHMDAILFALFICTDVFDRSLLQTQDTDPLTVQIFKEILRTEVANRLRKKYYCPASNIQAVAQVFSSAEYSVLPGTSDQILETIFQKVDCSPIISYSNGNQARVHRILATSATLTENVVTIQTLLEADLKLQNLMFSSAPTTSLILVLPDRTGELAPTKLWAPNLTLDLSNLVIPILDTSLDASLPCTLCGENGSTECADCETLVSDPGSDSSVNVFCHQCFDTFHQHWSRRTHSQRQSTLAPGPILELQSIICTREDQSIVFVKCGVDWIVHDSVCGSSPQVQHVFSLCDCLGLLESKPASILKDWNDFIPEVKIILAYAHMCIYAPPASRLS